MNDVFISYSRRDKVFIQKLYDCLTSANRSVWADWDSIPAASDWFAEIKQGIQETDSVVFVLSPEWIKSNECRKELNYAVEMGKRLFPILYIAVDPKDVPPELGKINWVYMRDTDDFDKAFQTLCSAMDTDLDWIKTHTRIQVRALEWEKKNRSASFALRGEDLTEGERFIAGGANKNPIPTQLQSEYVLDSRKDATKRQRQTLAGVTVALIVSIALGIATFFQRQEAVAQRASAQANLVVAQTARSDADNNAATAVANGEEAKKQAQIALARHLASQAQLLNNEDTSQQMIASLLSIQSLKLFPNADASTFLINHNFAAQSVVAINTNFVVRKIVPSPDSRYFAATGCSDETKDCFLSMRETVTGTEIFLVSLGDKVVTDLTFSQDGKHIIFIECTDLSSVNQVKTTCGENSSIRIFATGTGREIDQIDIEPQSIVQFSPDRRYAFWAVCDSRDESNNECLSAIIHTLEMSTKNITTTHITTLGQPFALSPDGKYIVSVTQFGSNTQAIKTGEKFFSTDGDAISSADFTPDGKYAAVSTFGSVYLWNLEDKKEIINTAVDFFGRPYAIISPDEGYLVATGGRSGASIWDVSTGKEIRTVFSLSNVSFSPNSKYFVSNYENVAIVLETKTGGEVARMTHNGTVNVVAFTPDGQHVLSADEDKSIQIWNATSGISKEILSSDERLSFSGNYKYIFLRDCRKSDSDNNCLDGVVQVWRTTDFKKVMDISVRTDLWSLSLSPNGEHFILSSCDKRDEIGACLHSHMIVKNVSTGKAIFNQTRDSDVGYLSFNANEEYFVWQWGDTIAHVWETATSKEVAVVELTPDTPLTGDTALSPDGKYLIALNSTFANLWEIETGKQIARLELEEGSSVTFSPNGGYLVGRNWNSINTAARVWEAASGKEIRTYLHAGFYFVFSPNSQYMASVDTTDFTVYVWDVATGKEIAHKTLPSEGKIGASIFNLAFSPDSKSLAYQKSEQEISTIYIWDFVHGNEIASLRNIKTTSYASSFPQDGTYLLSWDGSIWDLANGKQVTRMSSLPNSVADAFSPNGKYVISRNINDGYARVWMWKPEDIIANACAYLPRNPTRAEWEQFIGSALPYQAVCENLPIESEFTTTQTATP